MKIRRNFFRSSFLKFNNKITWKRFVRIHNSSSPLEFRMTFRPEVNCNFSSSLSKIRIFDRDNDLMLVFQQASEFMLFRPKNKFPLESMAEAADWVPFLPIVLNSFGKLFTSFRHAVALFNTLKGTEFSFSEARAWKINDFWLLSIAIPNIPSINSNDSPEIVWVPNSGLGNISSKNWEKIQRRKNIFNLRYKVFAWNF